MPLDPAKLAAAEQSIIRRAMSALGSRKSKAKSAAARANGKKGGRPRSARKAAKARWGKGKR